jgi:hypothetical protein
MKGNGHIMSYTRTVILRPFTHDERAIPNKSSASPVLPSSLPFIISSFSFLTFSFLTFSFAQSSLSFDASHSAHNSNLPTQQTHVLYLLRYEPDLQQILLSIIKMMNSSAMLLALVGLFFVAQAQEMVTLRAAADDSKRTLKAVDTNALEHASFLERSLGSKGSKGGTSGHGSHGTSGHGSHGTSGHGSHGTSGHGSHGTSGHGSHGTSGGSKGSKSGSKGSKGMRQLRAKYLL